MTTICRMGGEHAPVWDGKTWVCSRCDEGVDEDAAIELGMKQEEEIEAQAKLDIAQANEAMQAYIEERGKTCMHEVPRDRHCGKCHDAGICDVAGPDGAFSCEFAKTRTGKAITEMARDLWRAAIQVPPLEEIRLRAAQMLDTTKGLGNIPSVQAAAQRAIQAEVQAMSAVQRRKDQVVFSLPDVEPAIPSEVLHHFAASRCPVLGCEEHIDLAGRTFGFVCMDCWNRLPELTRESLAEVFAESQKGRKSRRGDALLLQAYHRLCAELAGPLSDEDWREADATLERMISSGLVACGGKTIWTMRDALDQPVCFDCSIPGSIGMDCTTMADIYDRAQAARKDPRRAIRLGYGGL